MASVLKPSSPVAAFDEAALGAVAAKAAVRLADAWRLTNAQMAGLANVADRTWSRIKRSEWSGALDTDQRLRVSALVGIYKALHVYFGDELADRWIKMRNSGPMFRGAAPLDYMLEGGLPAILRVRSYVDALRGGA